ncbi:MAG: T9SS type A sorting domain-containing protein [Jejuia sp.]
MVKQLLFLCLLVTSLGFSQTTQTITVDWSFNSTPTAFGNANTARTIEVGDTVQWNWYATGTHNVVATGGTETFASSLTSNLGINFSYTFNQEGTTTFVCTPHSGNMFGTITVVADGTLSTETFDVFNNISLYPNPVKNELHINMPINVNKLRYEIFNVLGNKVKQAKLEQRSSVLSVSNLSPGIYLIKISAKDAHITKRFIKS